MRDKCDGRDGVLGLAPLPTRPCRAPCAALAPLPGRPSQTSQPSRHHSERVARNGVGIRADGKFIFAISQGEVSFDAFARLFRDGLNCPNALLLDGGSASSLYAPSLNSPGNLLSLGPMLAVYERTRGASRYPRLDRGTARSGGKMAHSRHHEDGESTPSL